MRILSTAVAICAMTVLIGVDYAVTSDTPFSVSFPEEYMYPVVETNKPCVAHIHWPLEFHFVETNVMGTTRSV